MSQASTQEGAPGHLSLARLTALWERVLGRSPIAADADFFDIGGDSLLAAALFLEIEITTGRKLPIATIYEAPTIAALAALLAEGGAAAPSQLVLMKPGTEAPAVFIAHGVGGSVMELLPLAKRMRATRPVYAIQAKGINDLTAPLDRVEDMAAYYLEAIAAVQPHGPYILIGYSFGGLVVLEMAQRLGARGESVALLALLDTYPHRQYWPLSSWISVMARRARHQAALLRGMRPDAAVIRIRELWRSLLNHIRTRRGAHRFSAGAQGPQDEAAVSASLRRVLQAGIVASSRYRPRYFDGKITYLRAAIVDPLGLDDPASVWGRLARTLEIHTVAGDHKGMSTVHAESLAATLSVCIEEALEASERGAHDNGGSPFPAARDPLAAPPLPLVTRN